MALYATLGFWELALVFCAMNYEFAKLKLAMPFEFYELFFRRDAPL